MVGVHVLFFFIRRQIRRRFARILVALLYDDRYSFASFKKSETNMFVCGGSFAIYIHLIVFPVSLSVMVRW